MEEGGGGQCLDAFATSVKGKRRMIWWDPACRGDNRDSVMTPTEEGRKGHISDFPHPEIQTLGLVKDQIKGIKDTDYCGDLLCSTKPWHCAKDKGDFKKSKLGIRHDRAAMGPGVMLNSSREAQEAGKAGLSQPFCTTDHYRNNELTGNPWLLCAFHLHGPTALRLCVKHKVGRGRSYDD